MYLARKARGKGLFIMLSESSFLKGVYMLCNQLWWEYVMLPSNVTVILYLLGYSGRGQCSPEAARGKRLQSPPDRLLI